LSNFLFGFIYSSGVLLTPPPPPNKILRVHISDCETCRLQDKTAEFTQSLLSSYSCPACLASLMLLSLQFGFKAATNLNKPYSKKKKKKKTKEKMYSIQS
jgi:hypothetical protein